MTTHPIILDTGPLIALLSECDDYHNWSIQQLAYLKEPLITCEAVLTEASFLLKKRTTQEPAILLEMIHNGSIKIHFHLNDEAKNIEQLMTKYTNVPMSFADACLVRMAELYPSSVILTLDSDFQIYRKHGNQIIPVIMPDIH
ncbi:PIN domain-containing protein [Candidatus Halobeggiatoa sp. HSG11]|nr:PIN domain-containing protein [Candidatus Halobeggiatoa sp. HSG11]